MNTVQKLLLSLTLVIVMAKNGFGQQVNVSCDLTWHPYGLEYCLQYQFLTYSWDEARSYCANNSAYLVDELDSDKSAYLEGLFANSFSKHKLPHFLNVFVVNGVGYTNSWLGLNDKKNDGIYVWDRPNGVEPLPVSCEEYTFHSLEF